MPEPWLLQSFDEMLLMKRGGRIIYFGALGPCSCHMVQYFEVCPLLHAAHLCAPANFSPVLTHMHATFPRTLLRSSLRFGPVGY